MSWTFLPRRPTLEPLLTFSSIRALLCCCCSVAQSRLTLCDPVDCSAPGFPVLHHLLEFAHTHIHQVGDAAQPSRPLWPSALPALNLSQPSGSFPMSIQELISFRVDWFDLLAVQGALKSLLQCHNSKASILWCSVFFTVQL